MLGIATWQSPTAKVPPGRIEEWPSPLPPEYRQPAGPSGPYCRYFKAGTVIANDREAGVMVVETDDPHAGGHGYDVLVWSREAGGFEGEEVVPYDESLPLTAGVAHARALRGEVF